MTVKQTYYCDECGSAGQTEEFRQDPANFKSFNLSVTPLSGGDPSDYKQVQKHICTSCVATVNTELAASIFTELTA